MSSTKNQGVTLIECVLAIVITGTTLVAGLEIFGHHQVAAAHKESAWEALQYLGNEAERVRALDFDQLQSTSFEPLAENPDYEVQYAVVDVDSTCRRVTITIRWTSMSGSFSRRSLRTFRCEGVKQ